MESIAIVAGLLSALFWGLSPVVSKRGLSYGGSPLVVALIVVVTGFVFLWGIQLVTNGVGQFAPGLTRNGYLVFIAAGFIGTAIGRISNYAGVDRVGASINSSIISGNPLFATILAFFVLGEVITPIQVVGVLTVIAGLVALSLSRGGDLEGWSRRDLAFPILAGLAYGAGSVIRRYGLTTTTATPIEGAALNETAALVGILGFVVMRRRESLFDVPRRALGYFVLTGVLGAMGLTSLFVGLDYGRVAIVTVLSGTSPLVALSVTYLFMGDIERVDRRVVIGAILVVLGIVAITVPSLLASTVNA